MPVVDNEFLPTQATTEYLHKNHYTSKHIWKVVENFRINFKGQEFQNIQEKFKTVMKLEFATNAPKKEPDGALEAVIEQKSHKSKDGAKKAQEAKQQVGVFTKDEAIAWYTSHR